MMHLETAEMKRTSITKKNSIWLTFIGIILILGIGVIVGVQSYRENISIYEDMAFAHVFTASINVDTEKLQRIVERQDEVRECWTEFIKTADLYSTVFGPGLTDDPELEELCMYWQDFFWYIMTSQAASNEIRYFYIVIPTEDDIIYIWDSDIIGSVAPAPMDHGNYLPKEKENLMRVYRDEEDVEHLIFYREPDGEITGTAMYPIYGDGGKVLAVACLDISITHVRKLFLRLMLHIVILVSAVLIVTGIIYFSLLKAKLIHPIMKLTKATSRLVKDLESGVETDFQVDVHTEDEIEDLARSFEDMGNKLKTYIKENTAIMVEKERIDTELVLANKIQQNMVPNTFPPFPERKEIDLYASMVPEKEVGGDFYDFFMIDHNKLGLVIADVSGKGIPAALFMMMTNNMIRNYTMSGFSPSKVLETVNRQICAKNKEEMFVTVWIGILDLYTGVLNASNAGHEYPILKRSGEDFILLKDKHGFVVGGLENIKYSDYQLQLDPGTVLFVYTDGLTESTNKKKELYGERRLLETLNRCGSTQPEDILKNVSADAMDFTGSASQFDDITMLCLRYNGKAHE